MADFLLQNWGELLIALMSFVKVIVNLTPTENDNEIFAKLDKFINYFVKDKIKS